MKIDTSKMKKMHARGESDARSFIRGTNFCWVLRCLLHRNALLFTYDHAYHTLSSKIARHISEDSEEKKSSHVSNIRILFQN